jgi:DNA modification methylase
MASFAVANKKLHDLKPDTKNANKGTERGQQMIEASLRSYGAGRSILIDKNGRIIAGNKTAENFGAIGLEDVLVVQTDGTKLVAVQRMDLDLNDKAAQELAIADNRAGQVSLDWDISVLKELDVDLAKFWSEDELAVLLADKEPAELLTDEDDVPPVPEEPETVLGDLYVLGNHRLLCGDSTSITDVERLMDGQKADMVYTDPPYGVQVVKSGMVGADFGVAKKGAYQPIAGDDSTQAALDSYALCVGLGIETLVIWGGNYFADKLPASSCWIVWDKRADSGIVNTFADCELAWTNKTSPARVYRQLWNGMIRQGEHDKRVHPTQKPTALAEWCFDLYSKEGSKVLDLFGGSGSTMIAAEKTGRSCYMMEMSPAYCDVIVRRWEEATGKKAVRRGTTP